MNDNTVDTYLSQPLPVVWVEIEGILTLKLELLGEYLIEK